MKKKQKKTMLRKKTAPPFKQIAVSSGDDNLTYDVAYGLDENGRVWMCVVDPVTAGASALEWTLIGNRVSS